MKKGTWRIRDILDLEYLLQMDEKEEANSTRSSHAKRDREIYLKHIQPMELRGQTLTPRYALRIWLEERRRMEEAEAGAGQFFPGRTFDEIYRLLLYAMLVIGFVIGAGLAFSFLHYTGTEPLNVASYLGGFVLTQLFLLLMLLALYLIRSWSKHLLRSSVLFILITGLMNRLIHRVRRETLKALSGSRRDSLEAAVGLIQGKGRIYGTLFYWPIFRLSQSFMIAMNLGLLGATLLRVIGADIAFGWQSTIQFGAGFVFDLVKAIAFPWSWFVPSGMAYPTLAQIEGSHMVLKDGIYHLATQDLVSWWPFLCLSLIFYGLFPRLILLTLGLILEKKGLSRIDFSHTDFVRLYNRMKTVLVETEGRHQGNGPQLEPNTDPLRKPILHGERRPERLFIALIPDEIYDSCPSHELNRIVVERMGAGVHKFIRFNEDDEIERDFLKGEEYFDILLLQEAWQPPIREFLFYLKDLRKAVGKSKRIIVGLVGRPCENLFFTPIKEDDFTAWERKIRMLQDPFLDLERLDIHAG